MSIRRTGLLVMSVLLVPAMAQATGHDMEWSGGFSGASGSSLWGVHSVFGKAMPRRPGAAKNVYILVEASVYHGSEDGKDQTLFGSMAGPSVTFAKDPKQMATVSAHGLVGAFHTFDGATDFAVATGGSVDLMLGAKHSAENGWAVRFTADYVVRHGNAPNLKRASIQVVKRWGHY